MQVLSFFGSINDNNVDSDQILTRIKKGNIAFIKASEETIQIYISTIRHNIAAETWDFNGQGFEFFNDLRKKNPEKEFLSRSRKRWVKDYDQS